MNNSIFTSESVTEGHPDKIADQISDAVLDEILGKDVCGRVACETLVTTGLVLVAGEISTKVYVDIPAIARQVIKDIGYDNALYGFDYKACSVLTAIDEQSPDIACGVNKTDQTLGAGDQGMMFGFATNETENLMPLPIDLAHKLSLNLSNLRKSGTIPFLRPDGKTQVSVEYDKNGVPLRLNNVVVSTQHNPEISQEEVKENIIEKLIRPTCGDYIDDKTVFHINPTGIFVIGGPPADTGLTGRKIIVDTYGGMGRHGGGCFSGKDPSKVDRSGAYMARYIAKTIVANGLATKCEVQLAYAIGLSEPVSIRVETFGTETNPNFNFVKFVRENFNTSPQGIIDTLDLLKPIYRQTASYGHFGRPQFSWEKPLML